MTFTITPPSFNQAHAEFRCLRVARCLFSAALALLPLLLLLPLTVQAELIAKGDEVTDSVTKLIWKRCPEGMSYKAGTGTEADPDKCTGTATKFINEEALKHAKKNAGPLNWRLPTVKELSSIVDRITKRERGATIDPKAFPDTPFDWFWTSSIRIAADGVFGESWTVSFAGGGVYGSARGDDRPYGNNPYLVRLVRTSQ